jgi:hypothetical protein
MRPLVLIVACLLALAPLTAFAQVRISEGPNFTDGGKLLIVSGSIAGLEKRTATVRAEANAVMVVVCRDSGGRVVKRHRNVPARMHFQQEIEADMIAGGHAAFFLTSNPPAPKQNSCARGLVSRVEDVRFRTTLVSILQGGKVVFRQEFKP